MRRVYVVTQLGEECVVSSFFIWAVMTDCICLLIKWIAVENREPLMVKLRHSFGYVCRCTCVCACLKVFACELRAYFRRENVRSALEETPCFSSQVILFRLWNLPLRAMWLITCTEVIFCRLMKKLRNSVTLPIVCLYIPAVLFALT